MPKRHSEYDGWGTFDTAREACDFFRAVFHDTCIKLGAVARLEEEARFRADCDLYVEIVSGPVNGCGTHWYPGKPGTDIFHYVSKLRKEWGKDKVHRYIEGKLK